MKVLMFGRTGQVATALLPRLAALGEITALDRAAADLSRPETLAAHVAETRPDAVVIAAAYTAVDRAESEAELVRLVNAEAPGVIARAAAEIGALLIHYSTDYVFDGTGSTPHTEDEATAPLSVYGSTKRDGEEAVIAAGGEHVILRTSWVHAPGPASFAAKILKLARERDSLSVVDDQIGAPTSAALIANVTASFLARAATGQTTPGGIYHLAAAGETSWHGYAQFVLETAAAAGIALRTPAGRVAAIPSTQFPQAARRPLNSRLDTGKLRAALGIDLPWWQDGVRDTLGVILREAS
jgi:dTDP-4-dehydrorhamnose reductase